MQFQLGRTVTRIAAGSEPLATVRTDQGDLQADAFVLALGCWSAGFGRALGLDLPVYPIKGYSVTLPIEGRNNPPTLSGVDEDNLFAFANFGDRMRMTAIAEFAGWDTSHRPSDFAPMLKAARASCSRTQATTSGPSSGPACAR